MTTINLAFARFGGMHTDGEGAIFIAPKWLKEKVARDCEKVLAATFGDDGVVSLQGIHFDSRSSLNVLVYKVQLPDSKTLNRIKLIHPESWNDIQPAIKCYEEYFPPGYEVNRDNFFDLHFTPEELQEKCDEFEKYFLEG